MKLKTLTNNNDQAIEHQQNSGMNHRLNFDMFNSIGGCQYQNQVNYQKHQNSIDTNKKIKVMNQLCSQKGDFLQKITEIKFGNQTITIRDVYHFSKIGCQLVSDVTKKRTHIFKKPFYSKQDKRQQASMKATKNLPKNFIKAFVNYLQDVKNSTNKQLLDCKIKLFLGNKRYNNSFIQRIVDDQQLEAYFRDFLSNYAEEWINNSRIKNKKIHLDAIKIFMNLKRRAGAYKLQETNQNSLQQSYENKNSSPQLNSWRSSNQHNQKDSVMANQSHNDYID